MKRRTIEITSAVFTLAIGSVIVDVAYAGEIVVPDQMPLSVAIASASDGDVITINPSGSPYQQFPGISWSGKALTLRGSTGNPADVVIDGSNLDVVLRVGSDADGTVIENLTIRNGFNDAGNLNGNTAVGGGIALEGAGNVVVRNCVFESNQVDGFPVGDGRGAGIGVFGTNVQIIDCDFSNNQATDTGSDGGAVWMITGTHLISGCTFTSNFAADTGGAVRMDDTITQITDCRFEGNSAVGWGGAVWTRTDTDLVIDSSQFLNNTSDTGGAVDTWTDSGSTAIRNSLFVGNHAVSRGGALNPRQPLTAYNCTFVDNTCDGPRQTVGADTASEVDLYNCVVWNSVPVGDHILSGIDVRHSIVQGGFAGVGNLDSDPQLDADHMPTASSPAIDSGDTTLYAGPLVDLNGATRGVNDPDTIDTGVSVIGPVVDMGAFEFQLAGMEPPNDCPEDLTGSDGEPDNVIDTFDLLQLLGAWGTCPSP